MDETENELSRTSAIPSWSGFIYQGKVALYYSLVLVNQNDTDAHSLKVESLDDFVICGEDKQAISLHQVKATIRNTRNSYLDALKQASEVNYDQHSTSLALRYFHVAQELDDYTDFINTEDNSEVRVVFYTYCDGNKYVPVDEVDQLLNKQIKLFLQSSNLNDANASVKLKKDKLEALLAAKVNLAHRKNQEGLNKFSSADSTPITFSEITHILASELIEANDEPTILFRFRHHLLDNISNALMEYEKDGESEERYFKELASCNHAIAGMSDDVLTILYYSKFPHQRKLTLDGYSDTTTDRYMDIITELVDIQVTDKHKTLPHYYLEKNKSRYLPSIIELGGRSESGNLKSVQTNIEDLKKNQQVRHVLYEYENLIIKDMAQEAFRLKDKTSINNSFMDVTDEQATEKNRITKMMDIRFVALKEAKNELGS